MPEPEAHRRAVYDYADDEPRTTGRRRRQVADWGVGEELFDGMPGRRFERRGSDHAVSRGDDRGGRDDEVSRSDDVGWRDDAGRRGDDRGWRDDAGRRGDDRGWRDDAGRRDDAGSRGAEPHERAVPRGRVHDGRRTIVITEDDVRIEEEEAPVEEFASREDALEARRQHDAVWAGDEPFAEPADDLVLDDPPPAPEEQPRPIARGGVEGRRTVKIGGRPGEFHSTPRRRPSRTVHERLGPRPDRIAAWAFVLGILLILIAVATASV